MHVGLLACASISSRVLLVLPWMEFFVSSCSWLAQIKSTCTQHHSDGTSWKEGRYLADGPCYEQHVVQPDAASEAKGTSHTWKHAGIFRGCEACPMWLGAADLTSLPLQVATYCMSHGGGGRGDGGRGDRRWDMWCACTYAVS